MQEHERGGRGKWLQAAVVHDASSTVVWKTFFANKLTNLNLKHLLYKYLVKSTVTSFFFVVLYCE